jgi:hypothetical protein
MIQRRSDKDYSQDVEASFRNSHVETPDKSGDDSGMSVHVSIAQRVPHVSQGVKNMNAMNMIWLLLSI